MRSHTYLALMLSARKYVVPMMDQKKGVNHIQSTIRKGLVQDHPSHIYFYGRVNAFDAALGKAHGENVCTYKYKARRLK